MCNATFNNLYTIQAFVLLSLVIFTSCSLWGGQWAVINNHVNLPWPGGFSSSSSSSLDSSVLDSSLPSTILPSSTAIQTVTAIENNEQSTVAAATTTTTSDAKATAAIAPTSDFAWGGGPNMRLGLLGFDMEMNNNNGDFIYFSKMSGQNQSSSNQQGNNMFHTLYIVGIVMVILLSISLIIYCLRLTVIILVHFVQALPYSSQHLAVNSLTYIGFGCTLVASLLYTYVGFRGTSEASSASGKSFGIFDSSFSFSWCYWLNIVATMLSLISLFLQQHISKHFGYQYSLISSSGSSSYSSLTSHHHSSPSYAYHHQPPAHHHHHQNPQQHNHHNQPQYVAPASHHNHNHSDDHHHHGHSYQQHDHHYSPL